MTDEKPTETTDEATIKLIPVLVLRKDYAGVRAVRWTDTDGKLRAGVVPMRAIKNLHCTPAALAKAKPYSADFAGLLAGMELTTAEDIERELNKRGIWTMRDLQARRTDLLSAVNAAFGDVISALRTGMQEEGKRGE